jgi:hypothetical protein
MVQVFYFMVILVMLTGCVVAPAPHYHAPPSRPPMYGPGYMPAYPPYCAQCR